MIYKVLFRSNAGDIIVAKFDSELTKDAGKQADAILKLLHSADNLQHGDETDVWRTYIVSC